MNYDRPVVATTASIEGEVFVKRDGVELPLKEDTVLQAGDVIRTTGNSMALVSIPGTQKQTPAFLEISNGGVATLEFDPAAGVAGQVNVASNNGEGAGLVALVTEEGGENPAATLDGEEPAGEMSGLVGVGFLGAAGGIGAAPLAGAVGAAAIFGGLSDDDSETGTPGTGSGGIPAQDAGGLSETVADLTDNLSDLTEPVPVVSDAVDAVGEVLDSVLVGDNNGGLGGILTSAGEGLANGLDGTPLEPVGNVLDMVLGTVGDGLGMVADQISSLADNTPLDPLANLLGDVLGQSGPNTDGGVGGVVGTLTNVTEGLAQLLQPVPLLGELTGALDSVVNSISLGDNDGGLAGVVTGLGQGLDSGLADTPLALLGDGADALLGTLGGALGGLGDVIQSVGTDTPLAGVTDLAGELVGSLGGDVDFSLAEVPLLGDLVGGLTGGLGALNDGLELIEGIPLVGDVVSGLTSAIGSAAVGEGGLLGALTNFGGLNNGQG